MFGRGSWCVFGIRSTSQAAFETALNDQTQSVTVAQRTAVAAARDNEVPTFGINPFSFPRQDEIDGAAIATTEAFRLGPQQFGLWLVFNGFEDVTDPKSKLEGLSYETSEKPYKFLKKPEKEYIEGMVKASAVMSRKQFPVLIDFAGERVYAETTGADEIGTLRALLSTLGAEVYSVSWQFGGFDWPEKFLNHVWDNNKFHKEMGERAVELKRFNADEVEKLDDKLMESVVSSFFALSELETGDWAGLSTPARIRFYGGEPSSESGVSTAFTLKDVMDDDSSIVSASVTFQKLDSKFNKKDEEIQYRTDLFTIDINEKINIQDAGCATLRGFDMPQYKKDMKKAGKDKGSLTVKDYWMEWLIGMKNATHMFVENVIETLFAQAPQKDAFGLQVYEHEEKPEQSEGTVA
jgi:hypothetical protein